MITVLADKHLYRIRDFIPDEIELNLFDSNESPPEIPDGTDALLVRTVTKINSETFPRLPRSLQFIGTGSAGIDHIDHRYLKENGITFADAGGCNARSVAEYNAVALLLWADTKNLHLKNYRIGIIGVGHAGSAVQQMLQKIGIETVEYDPPREERDPDFKSATMNEVLSCDILTFHTPLTRNTSYPTFHWLDENKLNRSNFSLIINTARGGVIDEQALLTAFNNGSTENYILDVWENEPEFSDDVARRAFIKTPHIAGYSIQAKVRATKMIVDAMLNHFSLNSKSTKIEVGGNPSQKPPETFWSLTDALTYYHPIRDYETRLMMLIGRSIEGKVEGFNEIRTQHPLRNELQTFQIPKHIADKFPLIEKLTTK